MVASRLLADEPSDAQLGRNFTVRLVQVIAGAPLPDDLPEVARPSLWRPGYEMTFLIEGSQLARIKEDSVTLDLLRTKDGKDFRSSGGQPTYRQGRFSSVTRDGKYGMFSIESESASIVQLDGVQLRGSLLVTTAEGRETLKTSPLDLTQKQKLTLGEFRVGVGYDLGPSPLDGVARAFAQGLSQGFGQPDRPAVSIAVEGNLAKIVSDRRRQETSLARQRTQGDNAGAYEFDKAGTAITDAEFERVLQAQTSSRARAAQMQHAARYHIVGFTNQNPAFARTMSEKLEEILQRFKDDWDALERELRRFIDELRRGDTVDFPGLDARTQVPFVRLMLERCSQGQQGDPVQREAVIHATLDAVERIRQEIRKVGFWKNSSLRELLTRQLVRDLDGSGVCPHGQARDIAQRLVALAKENHESLTRE